jgi:hypothetical protein
MSSANLDLAGTATIIIYDSVMRQEALCRLRTAS